jgi:hypothetical protein
VDSVSGLGVIDREEDEGAVGSGGGAGVITLELDWRRDLDSETGALGQHDLGRRALRSPHIK